MENVSKVSQNLSQQSTTEADKYGSFTNPFIWADVPDPDVIRVGDAYYMTSTTMYFTPGCPVMKSKDLVNWEIVNYVYDFLAHSDRMTLRNGQHDYRRGSWASCLRYHNDAFYVTFTAYNTGKTYIFKTDDIEKEPWQRYTLEGIYHDMSLLFDDDGRVYMVYGAGTIKIIELTPDATAIKPGGMNKVIIEKANVGGDGGLPAEGAHIYKINGMYYIFLITWPPPPQGSGRRIELCYRSDKIDGKYEGKVILDDDLGFHNKGVAQGGIVQTPDGDWYSMLFQDHGAVGRIPVLVPVNWDNGWPVFGINGKAPEKMTLPVQDCESKNIVISDDFNNRDIARDFSAANDSSYRSGCAEGEYEPNGSNLALEWQWNHNYDNRHWSLTERPGWLRLTTGSICGNFTEARNTLTQRTFGPQCSGVVLLDVGKMKDGDYAGLGALQDRYGFVGIKMSEGSKFIIMAEAAPDTPEQEVENPRRSYTTGIPEQEIASVPLGQDTLYLKVNFDFRDMADIADFYYSLDGISWNKIGNTLKMSYRLTHFVGYRFALFNYTTKETGGHVDFDYFKVAAIDL